ncbi:MAG: 30S ribosomal protein S8 [Gemmatimonadaceae bacterium]|jgi:small subunit ribosomal protein S8|uniref:30S ribosomal protein S8 n=1 Tax=Gemmatimonas sp. TaxID=1962908 RepID=UPI001DB987F4|nr:30S ribosomal protein S8 [Gemmatimonas sp.]NCW43941.1 30S ribosomal protein S8 [Gemmatimonadaceae bacterium]
MSLNDPIADMLTRLRNACASRHRRVDMPVSKIKIEIARILKENAFVQDYRVVELEEGKSVLRVILRYAHGGQSVIREAKRISTPGLRKYVGVSEIPRVRNGLGMAILSTSKGIMSDRDARSANTGGELLALVW